MAGTPLGDVSLQIIFYKNGLNSSRSKINSGKRQRVAGSTYPLWHSGFQGSLSFRPWSIKCLLFERNMESRICPRFGAGACEAMLKHWVRGITG
jgi:hypothetical protein